MSETFLYQKPSQNSRQESLRNLCFHGMEKYMKFIRGETFHNQQKIEGAGEH